MGDRVDESGGQQPLQITHAMQRIQIHVLELLK